ncbi:MAG: 4-alpha-glucanotransferase [Clostridiales bacterium]|jgi:4-alpha-glucanotransferase|nr:4-alpha-glucanotransferase [Clostridiales bacterium]
MERASGVLMHISSLPGEFGIGSLGGDARKFIDFLRSGGFSYWQILPINEPDEYNSPYKSPSAFSGNPMFIDLEELYSKGLLYREELDEVRQKAPYICEFDMLNETRMSILRKAFSRIDSETKNNVEKFTSENSWVKEYAIFKALKIANNGTIWQEWTCFEPVEEDVRFYSFLQYEFFRQWDNLKTYANKAGVSIIGDMPFYVSPDSADVFTHRSYFQLDEKGGMTAESGVPPDYFSEEGQAWGNPLYDWEKLKKTDYGWWIERILQALKMFDKLRVDHFRGFSGYWAIPKGKKPIGGHWEKGPGIDFFNKLKEKLPYPDIIAEDLGEIEEDVKDLLKATGFPGMRVLQFGFINDDVKNPHLPYNYINNTVAYTGTHDNSTLLGWLWETGEANRRWVLDYCGFYGENWGEGGSKAAALRAVIKTVYQSSAGLVMLPVQDLCGFGNDTRMNIPGNSEHNWAYRITWEQLEQIDKDWIVKVNDLYGRICNQSERRRDK